MTTESPGRPDHSEKQESLVQLRERYLEVQKLVSSDEPYANLEWILGAKRNIAHDSLPPHARTIEIVALWLQDLAVEVERRAPWPPSSEPGAGASSPDAARGSAARSLRDATKRFLLAFEGLQTGPISSGS